MRSIRIGIIGLGTIGRSVAAYALERYPSQIKIEAILVRDESRDYHLPGNCLITADEDLFFDRDMDFVIEAAGHQAVGKYGKRVLQSSSFIVVSIGALAESNLLEELKDAALHNGRQIIVPSGAIGGLDRIAASRLEELESVQLITRKPPAAWYGTIAEDKVDLASVKEPTLLFSGPATESALLFPESVNVSAALSLAGIGFANTQVKVYVDPAISRNTHQIIAEGFAGKTEITIQNTPSQDNPKTGYIVAMSVIKVLLQHVEPFVIGI
jgi:aspartate dehydrogenase